MAKNIIVNISRDVIQEQIEKKDSKGIRYNSCRGVMNWLVRYDKKRRMMNDIKRDAMSKTLHELRTSNSSGYKSWVQSRKSTGNGRSMLLMLEASTLDSALGNAYGYVHEGLVNYKQSN